MPISRTLCLLAADLSVGLMVLLALVRRDEFGRTFDRLIASLAAGLALVSVWTDPMRGSWASILEAAGAHWTALLLVAVFALGIVAFGRGRVFWLAGASLAGVVALWFDSVAYPGAVVLEGGEAFYPIARITAAGVLGAGWVTMVGGHWYLVNPRLPIDPLLRLSRAALIAVFVRGAVAVFAVGWWWSHFDPAVADWVTVLDGISPFVLGRFLMGILLPVGAMFLVVSTVRIRSTQSATGILYIVFLFLLAGELMASYVRIRTGIPL